MRRVREPWDGGVVFEDVRTPGLEHHLFHGCDDYALARSRRDQGYRYFDADTKTFLRSRTDARKAPPRDYLRPRDHLL